MLTIGVSIAIPSPFGRQLQRLRASFGDPMAEAIPTHITLLPPTEVATDETEDVHAHLEQVAASREPFTMTLRGAGTFRPVSPVVFVQVAGGIAECEQIEQAVRSGPLKRDTQFYYHPHVTVAHHVPDEAMDRAFSELASYHCAFEVGSFHLYQHGNDEVWRPAREFAFGPRGRRPHPGEG